MADKKVKSESKRISMEGRKFKILIVHNYYQLSGGEDVVVANEKNMLEDNGHEVILYSRHNNEIADANLLEKLIILFATIFSVKTYREIRRIIKRNRIDIIHVHNTLPLISPAVYYAAKSCGVPVIQTVHNFRLLCPGALFFRDNRVCEDCVKYGLRCALQHKCYRNSRIQTGVCVLNTWLHRRTGILKNVNFICLTEFNKEKLLTLRQIEERQVFVKPNFVKMITSKIASDRERKDCFVYVGRLDRYKGIRILFGAWKEYEKKHKDDELIICGAGEEDEWCKSYISRNHLVKIHMWGQVSHEKAVKTMAGSMALIMPTLVFEGFGLTVIEAFSVGTPVICSNIGNVGELVEEGLNGYKFQPGSEKELVRVMEKIKEYPIASDTVKMVYSTKYSEKQNYDQLMRIYKTISERGSEGRT